jgi:2-amino-4-hydroxy-6-hydroxymethyldihydropteridine diphosphokinase
LSEAGEPPCFNLPIDAVVYLGLGSNLGDRGANLRGALKAIGAFAEIEAVSRVYESEPVGYLDQPEFWNLVARVRTTLELEALFVRLKQIESDLGRTPAFRNAPRLIDIDILTYDQLAVSTPTLEVPHPRMRERSFVLYPLAELEPGFKHPKTGELLSTLLEQSLTKAVPIGELE